MPPTASNTVCMAVMMTILTCLYKRSKVEQSVHSPVANPLPTAVNVGNRISKLKYFVDPSTLNDNFQGVTLVLPEIGEAYECACCDHT